MLACACGARSRAARGCRDRTPAWRRADRRASDRRRSAAGRCARRCASAPMRSLCSAMRLRSRQVICRIGSMPFCNRKCAAADARKMRLGAGAVGDVDRGRDALERQRAGDEGGGIGRDRRRQFGGDDEAAARQIARERADSSSSAISRSNARAARPRPARGTWRGASCGSSRYRRCCRSGPRRHRLAGKSTSFAPRVLEDAAARAVGRDDVEPVARDLGHPKIALCVEGECRRCARQERALRDRRSRVGPSVPSAASGRRTTRPFPVSAT